jgi:DNA-binding NtrC family response regulator
MTRDDHRTDSDSRRDNTGDDDLSKFDERTTQALKEGRRRTGIIIALRNVSTGEVLQLGTRYRWLLGSDPSCELRIVDPFVSGTHCLLERREDGSLRVRDRDSRNGTFVDGNHVEGAVLRVGSYLTVGRTTLIAVSNVASNNGEPRRALEMLRGRDPSIRMPIDQAMRAAQSDCSVLIVGETGTGKDLIARLVHEHSRHAEGPFVAVNCGAIPRELIASELFGHDRGAFTGATEGRDGYFVEANGGTLFLDEIGELPLELQPHLLRVLETRRVRRVGGQSDRLVDVRIVAATNRTAELAGENARLRSDLYHRLATVVLSLPPLRERMSDLVELVEAMLEELAPDFGVKRMSEDGWNALASYSWPGNVRELRHAVARAVALGGDELGPADFFPDLRRGMSHSSVAMPLTLAAAKGDLVPYQAMIKTAMAQALQKHGTIRAAADSLGMPKSTFADKAKEYGLMTRRRPKFPIGRR